MYPKKYDEDFKKSIVALFVNGKTQSELSKEYGVSLSAIKDGFAFTPKSKSVTILDSVTEIGESAFRCCTN